MTHDSSQKNINYHVVLPPTPAPEMKDGVILRGQKFLLIICGVGHALMGVVEQ